MGKSRAEASDRGDASAPDVRGRTSALTDGVAASLEAGSTAPPRSIPTPAGPPCIASIAPNIATRSATCSRSRSIAAALLPGDNAAYGFDNNADALSLSPALTERYLEAAARISQMALGHLRGSAPETVYVPTDRNQGIRLSDDQPWGSRGG